MRERALLEDDKALRAIDVSGMVDLIADLPRDMSSVLAGEAPRCPDVKDIRNIVFSGMGGSAIGGDVIRSWLGPRLGVPILVNRGYHAPDFADKGTLFISVSFSGNTEETLSAFEEAVDKGCKVVALSTGGRLEELAKGSGVVHNRVRAPEGMVPRAALGLMLVPMALLLEGAGLVDVRKDIKEAIEVLDALRKVSGHQVPFEDNECKRIASVLKGTVPVVTGYGMFEVAALRWKTQLNENSKVLAWADTLPEMDHNTIVGWSSHDLAHKHSAVILRDRSMEEADARLKNRVEATKEFAWAKAGNVIEVRSKGKGRLARILSTIYKGDWTSLYLAILGRTDPTPVVAIEGLKDRLGGLGGTRTSTK